MKDVQCHELFGGNNTLESRFFISAVKSFISLTIMDSQYIHENFRCFRTPMSRVVVVSVIE